MQQNYHETLRILVNCHRMPGESSRDLVNRIISDSSIFTTLVNIEPNFTNAELLKSLLKSEDFIESL